MSESLIESLKEALEPFSGARMVELRPEVFQKASSELARLAALKASRGPGLITVDQVNFVMAAARFINADIDTRLALLAHAMVAEAKRHGCTPQRVQRAIDEAWVAPHKFSVKQ